MAGEGGHAFVYVEGDPEFCRRSQRVDGNGHTWKFDGDDPYIVCVYCHEMRDAISGETVRPACPAESAGDGRADA